MNTESRRAERRNVQETISVSDTMTGQVVGRLGNLSESGMLLGASAPLLDDALYQLRFELPDRTGKMVPIDVGAHLVWIGSANTPGHSWAGLRFLTMPLQALRRDQIPGRYERWIFGTALTLALFGVVMVASSSIAISESEGGSSYHYLIKHLVVLAMGTMLGGAFALLPLAWMEKHARLFLLLALLLLVAVFLPGVGVRVNGAKRWLRLGISNFQVVEAVKLFVIIWLASYLVGKPSAAAGAPKPARVLAEEVKGIDPVEVEAEALFNARLMNSIFPLDTEST